MKTRSILICCVTGLIVIGGMVSFLCFQNGDQQDVPRDFGPYISDKLGLSYPQQYEHDWGKAFFFYDLTGEERQRAKDIIINTLLKSDRVLLGIWSWEKNRYIEKQFDNIFVDVTEECWSTLFGAPDRMFIPPMYVSGPPEMIMTYFPEEIVFEFRMISDKIEQAKLEIRCKDGAQVLGGNFSKEFLEKMLATPTFDGQTLQEELKSVYH